MTSAAFSKSPFAMHATNPGISISTGHPFIHGLFLHCKQPFASSIAISLPYPKGTSLKLLIRSRGDCSGISGFNFRMLIEHPPAYMLLLPHGQNDGYEASNYHSLLYAHQTPDHQHMRTLFSHRLRHDSPHTSQSHQP